jgi:hypothetical protein
MAILLKHRWIVAEGHVGSKENLTPINMGRLPLVALEIKHHGSQMNISSLQFFHFIFFSQTNHPAKCMQEMLCRERYLQR